MKLVLQGQVQLETSLSGALAGHRCDQIVLDLQDVRMIELALRIGGVQARAIQGIFEHLLTKFVLPS